MTIFLTILKVIGIILLVILGLILLILALVLFTPISYRLSANHNEEDTSAKAKVGFLIVRGIVEYNKAAGLDYAVKLLCFKIYPGKEKPDEVEDYEEGDVLDMYDEADEASASSNEDAAELSSSEAELIPDFSSDESANVTSIDTYDSAQATAIFEEVLETEDTEEVEHTADAENTEETENTSSEPEIVQEIEKEKVPLSEKIDEGLDKLDNKLTELDKKKNDLITKYDHVMQFLDREYVRRTITRALKVLKRLFGTIKPKKSKGYLRMGLSSSADTGMVLGKMSTLYPLYGKWLTVEPDFYNKVIEGDIDIKGRIYIFRFVFPVLRILISRDFWKTYKLAKKI